MSATTATRGCPLKSSPSVSLNSSSPCVCVCDCGRVSHSSHCTIEQTNEHVLSDCSCHPNASRNVNHALSSASVPTSSSSSDDSTVTASSSSSVSTTTPIASVLADSKRLAFLTDELIDYANARGVTVGLKPTLSHVPCTLFPTYIPPTVFASLQLLSQDFGLLLDRMARDVDFLNDALRETAHADPFVARLIETMNNTACHLKKQPILLGIHRSDYMLHVRQTGTGTGTGSHTPSAPRPLQVELNSIAAAAGSHSSKIAEMHKYLVERHMKDAILPQILPRNEAMLNVAHALAMGVRQFEHTYAKKTAMKPTCVLMIIHAAEFNTNDQRSLEYTLWDHHRIPIIRKSLKDVFEQAQQDDETGQLTVDAHTVAVVYFRAGYMPTDFPSDIEWNALQLLENSQSIKCPSIGMHLSGTKKIQQLLNQEDILRRFIKEEDIFQRIKSTQGDLFDLSLDDQITQSRIQEAIQDKQGWVLKPQREGGGNNLWGDEMVNALKSMSRQERAAFILMRRITPAPRSTAYLRNGVLNVADCISELGLFGACLSDGKNTFLNKYCGYLLRTKLKDTNEGGLASNCAVLDSIRLME